jgi:GNAT superfamily N-acetyltransferase
MGLGALVLDHDAAAYVLTLGVLDGWRGRGLALRLIGLVAQYAAEARCAGPARLAWNCSCCFCPRRPAAGRGRGRPPFRRPGAARSTNPLSVFQH